MIPATDDTNFVPSMNFTASVAGGRQVVASVLVTGGRPPYTYLWTGSDPAVSGNTGPSIQYTPKLRVAPPPMAITASLGNTATIWWPYPSTGFILQSNPNLASNAWTQVLNSAQTNNGWLNVTVISQPGAAMYFRLAMENQTLPVTETVALTVTDADGVSVHTNESFSVQAEPMAAAGGDPAYGTESPYDVWPFDSDQAGWLNTMGNPSLAAGSQAFLWTKFNSWPGDFAEPAPPGTLEAIPPENPPGPVIYADADYANYGVDGANLVMYMGHGNWDVL